DFSWRYPASLGCGVVALLLAGWISRDAIRRMVVTLVVLAGTLAATEYAGEEIFEKWRLRRVWAETHPDLMTPAGNDALYADGANLAMGPLIKGGQAFVVLVGAAAAMAAVRANRARNVQDATGVIKEMGPPEAPDLH
ncbi:MAG: hypothetical protein KDA61_13165, partial [Planctomycetales bacterium]|nr:hypothetical protein [Planctomycetales bacterium]